MSEQANVRRRTLEVLVYPRQIAMADVDLSACPHSGVFNATDASCQQCAKNYECDWLNSTDEFNDLAARPMDFLYRALAFGIDYVDVRNVLANHIGEDCDCDHCQWLQEARDIAHKYGEVLM